MGPIQRRWRVPRAATWGVVAGLVLIVAAAWALAPVLLRGRIERELRRRLGPDTTYETLRVGPGGVTVTGIRSDGAARGGSLRVGEARLEVFLPRLVWLSERAIDEIRVSGLELRIPLDARAASSEAVHVEEVADAPPAPTSPRSSDDEAGAPRERPRKRTALLPVRELESARRRLDRVLRRLGDGAVVRLDDGTVVLRDGADDHVVISGLEIELVRLDGSRLRTSGRGATDGGAIEWDVALDLRRLSGAGRVDIAALPLAVLVPLLPDAPWHDPLAGRLDGALELVPSDEASGAVDVTGWLRVRNLGIAAPEIAEAPLGALALDVAGEAAWLPSERRLALRDGRAGLGDPRVEIALSGWAAAQGDGVRLEAEATLPETPCRDAVAAIPGPVLAGLEAFDWSGTLQGHVQLRLDTAKPEATRLHFSIRDQCDFTSAPAHVRAERLREPFLHAVGSAGGTERLLLVGPGAPGWTPLDRVSPFVVHAVLAHEDAAFFRHRGFAPWAIETALQRNLREGRFAYGASTITMQLAKNLFLQRDKTLARKAREVLLTWWLEKALAKREILALYLNVIEYGPNVYGIAAAAEHYFGRSARDLCPAEAAFLATVLPAPSSYYRQFVAGELSENTRAQMRFLLERMHERGRIDEQALAHGLEELEGFGFGDDRHHPTGRRRVGTAAPLEGG